MTLRVLVTSAGSTASQNLLHFLRESSPDRFVLLGADCQPDHVARDLLDSSIVLPRGDDPDYVPALARAVQEHGVDVVVPVMEAELASLARAGTDADFTIGCSLLTSGPETIATTLSKRATYAALEGLGLGVPRQYTPSAPEQFPVFLKPDAGTGSRDACRCRTAQEFSVRAAGMRDPVAEALVEGVEYSLDGFADARSRLVHFIARERTEVRGGLSTRTHIVAGERFAADLETLVAGLGIVGFFNAQCIESAEGSRTFIDVNPRLGGAMYLSFVGGLSADTLIEAFVSGDYSDFTPSTRVGLKLQRRWHNIIVEGS